MAASLDPRRTPAPSKTQRRLQDLQTSRDALMRQRTAALNRRRQLREPLLKQQNQIQINMFERHLRAIDRKLQTLIAADEARARKLEILTSIPGIAATTAAGLLAEMPELGALSGKAAASLAGLAAVPRESGAWQGRAFIRGGRARARRLLYMPAVAALRWNPDLAEVYRRLSERGKPGKVALVAVMRKLIVLANTLVRQDRTWLPVAPRVVS
jgi:transposase